MKNLYILLVFVTAQMSFAQTTLTDAANKPVVGNSFAGNAVIGTVDNTATGANTTYNNASLTAGAAANTTYSAPTALEITTFPGSNIKQVDGSTTTLLFKTSTNKIEITGLTNPTATLNFSSNNATYLQFPVAFGYNNSDNAQGTFTSAVASGIFKGTSVGTASSSGTLIIGSKTYPNILRVKLVQNYNLHQSSDTFFILPIGNVTTTSYFYYDNANKFPLLTDTSGNVSVPLASINQTDNFAVAQAIAFLGNTEVKSQGSFFMYPNPAEDIVNFDGLFKDQKIVKIYSADGNMVAKISLEENKINVSELKTGTYFLTISGDHSETKAVKLIKK